MKHGLKLTGMPAFGGNHSEEELRAELDQMHDEFLLQCRQEFGDQGWACPGGGWQGR
ncbi:MAG: hypothetical protein WBG37_15035 [Desulfobacterales bacterium]